MGRLRIVEHTWNRTSSFYTQVLKVQETHNKTHKMAKIKK